MEETMKELYLETKNGNVPIDQAIIEKYNLKKGTMSPFTNSRIVDKDGEFYVDQPTTKKLSYQPDDGIAEMDHGLSLSTSEMLDIAAGVDSDVENSTT
jgi:hypothetical protein